MSQLLGFLAPLGLGGIRSQPNDDDMTDRVHYKYTVMVLIVMSVLVSTQQYVGDPIQCWVPGHFTGNHEGYANKACWVSNTYYLPMDERIPLEGERRQWINYYQWLPMILLTQAAFFYMPVLLWRGLNGKTGVHVHHLVEAGSGLHDPEKRRKGLTYMVRQMDRYLGHYRDDTQGCFTKMNICGKKYGNFLVVLYMGTKFLFLVNCLGQLFMMDLFLGTDFHFYGFRAMQSLTTDEAWPGSSRFPIFTICDYKVRQMGHNIHRNTLQCVLPINFFNEKLYLGLWFWFFVVCLATGANFFIWLMKVVLPSDKNRFIRRHLRAMAKTRDEDQKYVARFIKEYLRQDGVMIIRLVQMNTSDIVASELTGELFEHFRDDPPNFYKKRESGTEDVEVV